MTEDDTLRIEVVEGEEGQRVLRVHETAKTMVRGREAACALIVYFFDEDGSGHANVLTRASLSPAEAEAGIKWITSAGEGNLLHQAKERGNSEQPERAMKELTDAMNALVVMAGEIA